MLSILGNPTGCGTVDDGSMISLHNIVVTVDSNRYSMAVSYGMYVDLHRCRCFISVCACAE